MGHTSSMSLKNSPLHASTRLNASHATAFHGLPAEITLLIVQAVIAGEKEPCLGFITKGADGCFEPWTCKLSHPAVGEPVQGFISSNMTAVCMLFRHEAYTAYYRNNTFMFHSTGGDDALLERARTGALDIPWEDLRDPRATRLLDFVDHPEWKNSGSRFFKDTIRYQHSDAYRHLIRRIVINVEPIYNLDFQPDWDWPLKVDWRTLPDLEFLQLDLRGYSRLGSSGPVPESAGRCYETLAEGAQRMECLNLKRLVLVGLRSFRPLLSGPHLRDRLELLFRPAMAPGGEIECLDTRRIAW